MSPSSALTAARIARAPKRWWSVGPSELRFTGALATACVLLPLALVLSFAHGDLPPALVIGPIGAAYALVVARLLTVVRAQRRTGEDLQRSRALYRTLAEGDPDCVKLVERDGTISMMNRAGLAICGGSADHRRLTQAVREALDTAPV